MFSVSDPWVVWLDDGRPGHRRQAAALAERLSPNHARVDARLRQPWRAFAPRSLPLGLAAHRDLVKALPAEAPAAIVSCGRQGAVALRWLKRYWHGRTGTVQILDCGLDPAQFDFVVVPRHDGLAGRNVIRTLGSLNPVDEAWLAEGGHSPEAGSPPRIAALLGGPSRHCSWDRKWLRETLARLAAAAGAAAGRVDVVASPRTPDWVAPLVAGMPERPRFHGWADEPATAQVYRAVLAGASHLAATADSVNLLSEACATGKPVFVLGGERAQGRIGGFVGSLVADGYALDAAALPAGLADARPTRTLRETAAVAVRLKRSGLFG